MSRLLKRSLALAVLLCAASSAVSRRRRARFPAPWPNEKGALPGATVTARNVETDTSRTAQTDERGPLPLPEHAASATTR